jgi:hypothetical protein
MNHGEARGNGDDDGGAAPPPVVGGAQHGEEEDGYGHDGVQDEGDEEEAEGAAAMMEAVEEGAEGDQAAMEHHDNLARAHGEVADFLPENGAGAAGKNVGEDGYSDDEAGEGGVDVPEHLRGGWVV